MDDQKPQEQIKQARRERGMTQQDLANQSSLSLRTIQRIEKGDREVSGFSLRQISRVLDLPLEKLIVANVDQIAIEASQVRPVKALYLASLLFLVNPILGLIVPSVMGYLRETRTSYYSKHLKFILVYFGIANVLIYGYALTIILNRFIGILDNTYFISMQFLKWFTIVFYFGTLLMILLRFFFCRTQVLEEDLSKTAAVI